MFCKFCGFENRDSKIFCQTCGGTDFQTVSVASSRVDSNEICIRLKITNNKTGEESVFESSKRDVLIGSSPQCDLVLEGEDVMAQHCCLRAASNHLFLKLNRGNKNELVLPVYELSEHGTNYHWNEERRIDSLPLEIGQYRICRF